MGLILPIYRHVSWPRMSLGVPHEPQLICAWAPGGFIQGLNVGLVGLKLAPRCHQTLGSSWGFQMSPACAYFWACCEAALSLQAAVFSIPQPPRAQSLWAKRCDPWLRPSPCRYRDSVTIGGMTHSNSCASAFYTLVSSLCFAHVASPCLSGTRLQRQSSRVCALGFARAMPGQASRVQARPRHMQRGRAKLRPDGRWLSSQKAPTRATRAPASAKRR